MANNLNILSQAIAIYIGFGIAILPSNNKAKVIEVFGQKIGDELVRCILGIMDEVNGIPIDWAKLDLDGASRFIRNEIHARHPDLDDIALNAIAWKFTYDWR
ncbi:MAG: hypothetical protein ACYDEV_17850 [Acidiferrobacter sp.]